MSTITHGRPQEFFQGWAMRRGRGLKDVSPPAGHGQSHGGGLRVEPPKADDIFST